MCSEHLRKSNIWIGHTIRHNECVVNILEGAISGKRAVGRPRLQYLKHFARNTETDSCTAMKKWLATIPDGKPPTNQKTEGWEEEGSLWDRAGLQSSIQQAYSNYTTSRPSRLGERCPTSHTVAYDGACSPNVSVNMAWISFGALPCRGGDLTARVSM